MPKFKRQTKGNGPRKKLTLYVRDTKGVIQRDAQGKPKVDKVIWRGHGYVSVEGQKFPTQWATAKTREELNKAVDALVKSKLKEIADAGPNAIFDLSGKSPIIIESPSAPAKPHRETATVNDVLRLYMESDRTRQGQNTKELYEGFWRTHILVKVDRKQEQPLGQVRLRDLSYSHMSELDDFLAKDREAEQLYSNDEGSAGTRWIARKKLSPKTFADLRNMLRAAFNYVAENHKEYVFQFHPGSYDPKRTWSTKAKTDIAATDEYYALVKACQAKIQENPTNVTWKSTLAFMTLVRHALRPAEAQGLQWSDWDDNLGGFHIKRQVVGLKGGEQIQDIEDDDNDGGLKTHSSADIVLISPSLLPYIEITKGISDTWVLPNAIGKKWISRRPLDDNWKMLKEITGISKAVTPYTLKHGMIRDLMEAGKSPDQVMFLTRHTTPAMIKKVYGSLEKKSLLKVFDQLHEDHMTTSK